MNGLKVKCAVGGVVALLGGFTALTTAASAQPLPPGDRWTLDDAAGSTSAVDTGGTNPGLCGSFMQVSEIYSRTVDCPTFGVPGEINTAAQFDGTDDGLRINNLAYDDFTMTAWINTTQAVSTVVPAPDCHSAPPPCWPDVTAEEGAAIIWGANDNYNGMIPMALVNGGHIGFGTGACPGDYADNFCTWYDTLTGGPVVNTGAWVFVAVTRNETTGEKQLWINGTEVASDFAGGTWSDNESPYLVIGENPVYGSGGNPVNSGGTTTHFNGNVDDVQIFPSVLSGAQIAEVQAEASPARATSTVVNCSPGSVVVSQTTSCTATVTDIDAGTASTPTGIVSFSSDTAGGSFSGSGVCTLSPTATPNQAQCSVSYTPGQVGSGTHTITGAYGGDSTHAISSGNTTVAVSPRATSTVVGCSPTSVVAGQSTTTCTATVTDIDTGTASTPTGSVSFSSDTAGGSFSTSGVCTLSPTATPNQARCSVSYTPGQVGSGTHTITGAYGGDSTHAISSGHTTVAVSAQSTATRVICRAISSGLTRCLAGVGDRSRTGTTPTGTVTFMSSAAGTFPQGNTCTLSGSGTMASCGVTYKPVTGTQTITGTYNGDSSHGGSSGTTTVTL